MKFKNLPELKKKVAQWEKDRTDSKLPLTITSLALALETTRETLLDFEKAESEYHLKYSDTIKLAKLKCHAYAEDQLYVGKTEGAKFNLKNNWGWKDKTESELTGKDGGPVETNHTVTFVDAGND